MPVVQDTLRDKLWWRHQMETFSALLAICAGNSPVSGEFPAQRPVTRSFYVFYDLYPNKRLSKQLSGWWFETHSPQLWRHSNGSYQLYLSVCFRYAWVRIIPFIYISASHIRIDKFTIYSAYFQALGILPAVHLCSSMMTSSNGNIFRVTVHLCGEFTGLRWIPRTKASDAELWCFLWSGPE